MWTYFYTQFLSNEEFNIKNHQVYISSGFYADKYHISNNLERTFTDYKGVLICGVYDYEEDYENPHEGAFFTRSMKLYSRPDGFMLYGKLGIDFLTTSESLYRNIKLVNYNQTN